MLVLEQTEVARVRVQASKQAKLMDYVYVMPKLIRNTSVPHGDSDQVSICRDKATGDFNNLIPRSLL